MIIFGIHPADSDLKFLLKVNEELKNKYSNSFNYLRLEANIHSHEECISVLKKTDNGLVFFFCHALDKSIRGCKIEHQASALSYKDFNYGSLISPNTNIEVFKGKSVFCLACNSKDLGADAINAGAKVFLGFGEIPFYIKENFKEDKVEAAVKYELRNIILNSIFESIDKHYTFNDFSNYIQISIYRRIFQLLVDKNAGANIRMEVAKVLSRIKNGITMFGNGELLLNE